MPDCSALPVVTTLARFFVLRARLRVRLASGIPCALCLWKAVDEITTRMRRIARRSLSCLPPILLAAIDGSAIEGVRPPWHHSPLPEEPSTMQRRKFLALSFSLATVPFVTPASSQTTGKPMTTASGLQIIDTKDGTGASPKPGQTCVMHYTGWLYENGQKGKKFDSSVDRNEPFEFPIGQKRVIAGWDEGVASMKVGGKRTLIIPPALGYGARGAGGVIPANATLMFDVELLGVK
jgi:peptidylprolyl isomerase